MIVKELFEKSDLKRISLDLANENIKDNIYEEDIDVDKLQEYIYSCLNKVMEIVPFPSNGKIICVTKRISLLEEISTYYDAILVKEEDLLTKEIYHKTSDEENNNFDIDEYEKKYVQGYAFEFDPWVQIMGYEVADASIKEYGIETVAKAIFDEMTFFGYEEEKAESIAEKEMETILKSVEEISEHPENLISSEDLYKELGIIDDRTEEEKEADKKIFLEEMRINHEESVKILETLQKQLKEK